MLSRVLQESFFAHVSARAAPFSDLPESHSILRRSLSQGGRQRFFLGIFARWGLA
jgi:hypothetical protein